MATIRLIPGIGLVQDSDSGNVVLYPGGLVKEVSATATTTATITGTGTANITEVDTNNGGKTLIITLTGDTWVAAGATFDAQRQPILDGIVSAQSEADGWNNVVSAHEPVTSVVRTSNTVVTITLIAH